MLEQDRSAARPAISWILGNPEDYDVVFLGYPIRWVQTPKIMDMFLERCDFFGKTMVPFCTSGSSGNRRQSRNASRPGIGRQLAGWSAVQRQCRQIRRGRLGGEAGSARNSRQNELTFLSGTQQQGDGHHVIPLLDSFRGELSAKHRRKSSSMDASVMLSMVP